MEFFRYFLPTVFFLFALKLISAYIKIDLAFLSYKILSPQHDMHFSWQALIFQLGMWFIFTDYISQENKISQLRPKVIRILWLNFCGFVLSSLCLNKFRNARMALRAQLIWAVFNHNTCTSNCARAILNRHFPKLNESFPDRNARMRTHSKWIRYVIRYHLKFTECIFTWDWTHFLDWIYVGTYVHLRLRC